MENATEKKIKRLRSDNGGKVRGSTVQGLPQPQRHQAREGGAVYLGGTAWLNKFNRSLVEMGRSMLFRESIQKKGRRKLLTQQRGSSIGSRIRAPSRL
ncbi:hypothetical protein L915_11693, partial [Phytophthora nicotianae]